MLTTFIFSYLESFFVVFHLSFYFILALAISAREDRKEGEGHRHCTGTELMPLRKCSSIHSFDSLLARLVVCLWGLCEDSHMRLFLCAAD